MHTKSRHMKKMKLSTLIIIVCVSFGTVILTMWLSNDTGDHEEGNVGVFGRLAAPILTMSGMSNLTNPDGIACYFNNEANNKIDEITTSSQSPAKGESIFFHETSCTSSIKNDLVLTPRQACAVESAAKMHPERQVYVLFTSPIKNSNESEWSVIVQQLLSYPNVYIRHLDFANYFIGTPLEEWYRRGSLKTSRWPRSHSSDLLRYLTLWRFGGTYLDLDVVVIRSLDGLKNFAGAESGTAVAAGVLNLDSEGAGHEIATACLLDLRSRFRGDNWGNNGPGVITRVLKRLCKANQVKDMTQKSCDGFTVHPPSAFYPIPWRDWKLYFEEKSSVKTMARLNKSLAIHVWNKFSVARKVVVGSRQPYGQMASKFCPKVYGHSGHTF